MTLGRCPLSIFCSRGTPPGARAHAPVDVMNENPLSLANPESIFFFTLVTGPRRSLSLKLSDTRFYESMSLSFAAKQVTRQHMGTPSVVQRFRGGLVFKAHRRVYHSTLGLRVTKKKQLTRQHMGT